MEAFIDKKYKMKTSDGFDDYLKFIGVGLLHRKAAGSLSPESVLSKNADGSFTITVSNPLKTVKSTFKVGEEFDDERLDGAKVKSKFEIDGNKLIETQVDEKGLKVTTVREFTPEVLTATITAEGWDGKSVRVYHLVK